MSDKPNKPDTHIGIVSPTLPVKKKAPARTPKKVNATIQVQQATLDRIAIGALSKIDEKEISKTLAKGMDKIITSQLKEVLNSSGLDVINVMLYKALDKVLTSDVVLKRIATHMERGVLEAIGMPSSKKSGSKKNKAKAEPKGKPEIKKKEIKAASKKDKKDKKRKKNKLGLRSDLGTISTMPLRLS